MTKDELRAIYRQERLALSKEDRRERELAIVAQLKKMDWSVCRYLHVYRAIHRYNEPDLSEFYAWLKENHPKIQLVVSLSDLTAYSMSHYVWDEHTIFVENKWGIQEPVDGVPVNEIILDVILVPMLVADRKGNRIGYGKGFYDRFLAQCRPDARTVGVSFFDVLTEEIDAGPWDIPLKSIVTPKGFFAVVE
jgi:5-formyltetrahydrofolate cyclo-ligase